MLALKQALSLVSIKSLVGWSPLDESSLETFYKNKSAVEITGSGVSQWDNDKSGTTLNILQPTDSERPTYESSTGKLSFDPASNQNLQLEVSEEIRLIGALSIGIRTQIDAFNNVILGSNTLSHEFFKFTSSSAMVVKVDGVYVVLGLDSGTWSDSIRNLVITRDGSNVWNLWVDGVQQALTPTVAGTINFDAIGVRATDLNSFSGDIYEVQIFSSQSSSLTSNINERLSNL